MKENDYILANILNPGFSNQDFKDILGMTMENTLILPYSSYTSSPFITSLEIFKDDNGNFSEPKFKEFYTLNLGKFDSFNDDIPLIDNFEYSIFDTSRKSDSRIKDPDFKFNIISNPNRYTIGISGRNVVDESPLSKSEIALQSKIWDTEKGEWMDYSPNDISFTNNPLKWFASLFEDPLVLATYDEAGEHTDPITKETVHHEKGDLILNDEGQYFYETLNGRSLVGKQVLSSFDYLTVDGEGINKYDFIDSDGLDKSIVGTIAKTALTVAPLFWSPASAIYGGALVARELAKSLPMLYGMVSSVWGDEEDSTFANTLAAYGNKFTTGTSEYSKQNVFTFENIASLLGDVATQWGQLKLIANSINKLRGSNKLIDEALEKAAAYYRLEARSILQGARDGNIEAINKIQTLGNPEKWMDSALGKAAILKFVDPVKEAARKRMRLGADASLAYMAIVSNTDVYLSVLQHGASKRDAALVAFGSTLGMFSVDRFLGLGELFFDELRDGTRIALRNSLRNESSVVARSLIDEGLIGNPEVKTNAFKKLVTAGMNMSKNIVGKFSDDVRTHSTGFFGKAIGEGLEEMSEELVTDLSKQFYEIAGEFSPNFFNESGITEVGAFDNMGARYGMSLLGGFLGGGMFYGVNTFLNGTFKRDKTLDELIYLVANHKTPEILKELDRWKAAGKFGSKTLSASKYELDNSGNRIYLTASNEDDSQNTFIYNRIKESVLQLEHMLNYTGTNRSEEELFKQMVLNEQRFLNLKEYLGDQSYLTKYQENFRTLTRLLIDTENLLNLAYKTEDGTPAGKALTDNPGSEVLNNPIRLNNIKNLEDKLKELRKKRDDFLSGKESLPYVDKLLFAIDEPLRSNFISLTYDEWLKANKGKTVDLLSLEEKETFKTEYLEYKKNKLKLELDQAYELYLKIGLLINPHISSLAENAEGFKLNHEAILKLFTSENPFDEYDEWNEDVKLEGESDEEYANRNKQLEGETDEDYINRVNARRKKIQDHNDELMNQLKNKLQAIIDKAGGYIDPSTLRLLSNYFIVRKSDTINGIIKRLINKRLKLTRSTTENNIYEVIKNLNPDFSNLEEIRDRITRMLIDPEVSNFKRRNEQLKPIRDALVSLLNDFGYDTSVMTGATILNFASNLADRIIANDPEVINKFKELELEDVLKELQELNKDEMIESILFYESGEDSLLDKYIDEKYEDDWYAVLAAINENPEGYNMTLYSDEEIDEMARNSVASDLDWMNNTIQLIIDNTQSDPFVQLMNTLESSVSETNPITQLLKLIHVALDPLNRSIEQILDALYQKSLGLNSKSEFILKMLDEQTLDEVASLLQMVSAYLYAASANPSYAFPTGHNSILNSFAQNHKDIFKGFKELPTLDNSVINMYLLEIQKYLNELDPDSQTSWRRLSSNNRRNKRLRFITTENKYNEAKLELFNVLKTANTKFTIDDKTYDLLDGIERIMDENPAVKLYKIENLFYINLHKALNAGISFKEILLQTKLLEAISKDGDLNDILNQKTSDLDETINYGKLTAFDKFIYLLTISGISANDFNLFIKKEIESQQKEDPDKRIVPLTIQEQTSRLAMAHIKSKDLFLQAFDYLSEVLKTELRPFLSNIVFVDGSAGVGKTTVIAKQASKYLDIDQIWLVAPQETLLTQLQRIIDKGEGLLRSNLFKRILDPDTYDKLMKLLNDNEFNTDLTTSKPLDDVNTVEVVNNIDRLIFNAIENLPKFIIIDEITHFSSIELQILNEFAKRNNISIIGLGDSILNGFTGTCRNINREKLITFRSSRLSITLRDVNMLKQDNLIAVSSIITDMSRLDSVTTDPNYLVTFASLIKKALKLNLSIYNEDELNGDLITSSLTVELVNKLHGTVAFVGDTNGQTYKTLIENYSDVKVLKPDEIQGLEFDYIVVDQLFEDPTVYTLKWFDFLTNLYTLMSRGRVGSIFIDNGLSNIIGKNTISANKETAPNLREALDPFIESKLEFLEKELNPISSEEFEKLITNTETPTSETPPVETPPVETPPAAETPPSAETPPATPSAPPAETPPATPPSSSEAPTNDIPPIDDELDEESETRSITDYSLVEPDAYKSEDEVKKDTESLYNITLDKTDERINESDSDLDEDFPIRVYGSAHFSGLIESKETRIIDGVETQVTVHTNPHNPIKEDLQIFMTEDKVEGREIKPFVDSLLNLKSVILYGDDPKILHPSVSSIVNAEHLKDIKFKLEVRPIKDTDNFVGLTGLLKDKLDSINKGLVYVLVAEFKNNAGEDCKITLGLMADPKSYFVPLKFKGTSKEKVIKDNIKEYTRVVTNITKQYEEQHKKGKTFSKEVHPHFSGVTNIRTYTGSLNNRTPIKKVDLETFRKTHPHSVISNPYIFIGDNFAGYNKIDALRGRAVVFVSNDTTLKPDDLMRIYIEQKEATNREAGTNMYNLKTTKPRVRMLMLDPKGVSFRSLLNYNNVEKYQTTWNVNGDTFTKELPFEEEYMGMRMYVSLWNYRVNLIKFLEAYKHFFEDTHHMSSEDVARIARYSDALYRKSNSDESDFDEEIELILSNEYATIDELKLLEQFNNSLAPSVRQFRLGGSRARTGTYLRTLTNITSSNPFYKDVKGKPIGIYITHEIATKQLLILNSLLNNSLGSFIKLQEKTSGEIKEWPADRLISPKLSDRDSNTTYNENPKGYRNSVSGLLSEIFSGDSITIEENGKEYSLNIPANSKKSFVIVPLALLRICKAVHKFLNDPDESSLVRIKIGLGENLKVIPYEQLLTLINPSFDFDYTLDNLLALAFHGTTVDPNSTTLKATDAYFKHGLFVDPMGAEVVGTTTKGSELFKSLLTNESLFEVGAEIDMPIFTMTFNELNEVVNTPETVLEVIPQEMKDKVLNLGLPKTLLKLILKLYTTVESIDEFEQKYLDTVSEYYKESILKSIKNNKPIKSILNSTLYVFLDNGENISVLQALVKYIGDDQLLKAKFKLEDGVITATMPDGKTIYDITFNEYVGDFEIHKINTNIAEPITDKLLLAKNNIIEYLNDSKRSDDIDEFRNSSPVYESIYLELTTNLDLYKTIESLDKALQEFYDNTDYSSIIEDIMGIVNAIKNNKNCK